MHVLVTGVSGFIGRSLAKSLEASGFTLRGVGRSRQTNDQIILMDISAQTDWTELLQDIDAVIHLADGSRVFEGKAPPLDQFDQTVQATKTLAAQAAQSGVKQFIYLSSVKAVSGEWAADILDENGSPNPDRSVYGHLKWDMEQSVLAIGQETDMRVTILRPPLVYGPGGTGNFQKLIGLATLPYPLPFGTLNAKRSMIGVSNLGSAIEKVLIKQPASSLVYFVSDGPPVSIAELVRAVRQQQNKPARVFRLPFMSLLAYLPALGSIMERLARPLVVSGDKFCKDFDWHPPMTTIEGLALALGFKSNRKD